MIFKCHAEIFVKASEGMTGEVSEGLYAGLWDTLDEADGMVVVAADVESIMPASLTDIAVNGLEGI